MDLKVYTKEEILQPSGALDVVTPNVIDIIPDLIMDESNSSIKDHIWTLDQLSKFADIKVVDNKLYINSDNVSYVDGKLVLTLLTEQLYNAQTVEGKEELEQQCSLATIWQKGLDPLAQEEGVRWSEVMLGEINVVQLMNDITQAIEEVTTAVTVVFDTVEGNDGNSYLTYTIKSVG